MVSTQIEMRLNDAFVSSFLDLSGVRSLSQEQMDGSEDDAFTSSRLTGDDRESRMEINVELIDEREILDI